MRRKALKGVANTLCHMVDGDGRYPDETRLARFGTGVLVIDALSGRAPHDGLEITPDLELAKRMHRWLLADVERLHLPPAALLRATVTVPYQVKRAYCLGERLWELTFTCSSEVATSSATYVGTPIPGRPRFGGSIPR